MICYILSMVKRFFFFAIALSLYTACSNSSSFDNSSSEEISVIEPPYSEQSDTIKEFHEGMILVEGSERVITIGTNEDGAKETEKPELKTILNYDYFLDSIEVGCESFKTVMHDSKIARDLHCTGNQPVTDITFFDAVLFANKKSNEEKLDSVYEYTESTFDEEGHCTNLSGFLYYTNRKGYRLPTEAEWIKAATSSYGFKNFSGKIMEWSNDFLGKLKDTTLINFAGAQNANDIGERIVKGYNTSSDSNKINLHSRGDVYTVTSAAHANYIGFRLAIGEIPNAVWLDNSGHTSEFPLSILASATDLWSFSKTTNMKLVFRNDLTGNLAYIDYAESGSTITEIVDTISAYHPDISPDGKRVAFCSGIEGLAGQSSVYVRNLDSTGSHLTRLNVESAAIPRWNILENGDTVITYVTNAGNNKDKTTFQSYSTWLVPFTSGKFGTPQKLFDGAYHGGVTENGNFAVTGARLLRVRKNGNDTIWYNGEQACNASLAKDNSKRTAFLDFAGKTGKAFVGKKYSTHQYILVVDSTGTLIDKIESPNGYTFDHSEWVDGETNDNMVATLVNSSGAHKRITLLNMIDKKHIDLLEGNELWHPCFWIKKKDILPPSSSSTDSINSSSSMFILDPDSAGMYYNNSGTSTNAIIFRYKMELLWQFKDSANVVILGSSRSYFGIMPRQFNKNIIAVNLAVSSTNMIGHTTLFNTYIKPHYKKLKLIIISIDLDRGHFPGTTSANMFYNSYKSYAGYVYDKNHNYWVDEYPQQLYQMTYDSPGSSWYATALRATRGHKEEPSNGWGTPVVEEDSNWVYWTESSAQKLEEKFQRFEELLSTCKMDNIIVIGVIFPQNPAYKETGALGRHGMTRSSVPQYMQRLDDLRQTYPNFILMDENKMGDHDYTDEMAMDTDHLSTLGAAQLSHRLDSLIQTLNIDWASKE